MGDRHRKALLFYANHLNYEKPMRNGYPTALSEIDRDFGAKAREALEHQCERFHVRGDWRKMECVECGKVTYGEEE